jgi:hypothetical protein
LQPTERATPEEAEILVRLIERLADPGSWLPADSWEQREVRAYVPSRYAVCYGESPPTPQGMERSDVLNLLPAGARDILGGKDVFTQSSLHSEGGDIRPTTDYCSVVTVDEARTLQAEFDAGAPTGKSGDRVRYAFAAPAPSRQTIAIKFEPYLPHGEFICSGCG